jgi:hypothetical protein
MKFRFVANYVTTWPADIFTADTLRRRILVALEDIWRAYRRDSRRWPTLIDYFLARTSSALTVP